MAHCDANEHCGVHEQDGGNVCDYPCDRYVIARAREEAPNPHLDINGEFQSDKYPTCPAGKVPLSTKDPMAQDLLWEYAQRRRMVDEQFSIDLEIVLKAKGYTPPHESTALFLNRAPQDGAEWEAFDLRAKIGANFDLWCGRQKMDDPRIVLCTRRKGHVGDHVACCEDRDRETGVVIARWPR